MRSEVKIFKNIRKVWCFGIQTPQTRRLSECNHDIVVFNKRRAKLTARDTRDTTFLSSLNLNCKLDCYKFL